jgi:hypothetical protein
MTYTLTETGLDKLQRLQTIRTDIEEAIHGSRSVQSKHVEYVLSDDLADFRAGIKRSR